MIQLTQEQLQDIAIKTALLIEQSIIEKVVEAVTERLAGVVPEGRKKRNYSKTKEIREKLDGLEVGETLKFTAEAGFSLTGVGQIACEYKAKFDKVMRTAMSLDRSFITIIRLK